MLSDHSLKMAFGFTAAEARLASRLLAGATLKVAAKELGITYETARSTLKSVFQKTGARRQAELILKLSRTAAQNRNNAAHRE